MMKFLRSQSQAVLILILGVLGLSFVFYGNVGSLVTSGVGRDNDFGRIDGQDLSVAELTGAIDNTRDALLIMGRSRQVTREQVAEEAWTQLLLLHEADKLHIEISNKQLVDYIQSMAIFQKDGVYSPELYQSRMTDLQNTFHVSPGTFETIMRDLLRTDAVAKALFSTVRVPVADVSAQYDKYFGPTQVSIVTFDPKTYANAAKVNPEEIEAEYKAHPDNPAYRTAEKRKVDYVIFPLSPDQAKLPDKEKETALEALGEKALDFALAFQPEPSANGEAAKPAPDFAAEATKRGLAPVTTDFFAADSPPSGLPPSPAFNSAAFSLSQDNPISKVIQLSNGVAVLHLNAIDPSELRSLAEVTPQIEKQLQQSKGVQAAEMAATSAAQTLQNGSAKGADFKTLAGAQGLRVDSLPSFIPAKAEPTDQRLQTIAYVVLTLDAGQVSQPVPVQSDETVLLIHVDSRGQADPVGLADFEKRYRASKDDQLRGMVYTDWADWQSKRPGTHKPPNLDQYGGVD